MEETTTTTTENQYGRIVQTTLGTRPNGSATGTERWLTIDEYLDDGPRWVVTYHEGWTVAEETSTTARHIAKALADVYETQIRVYETQIR